MIADLFLFLAIEPKGWDPNADVRGPPGLGETSSEIRHEYHVLRAALIGDCLFMRG
jgi:hypothetical protein